MPIARLPDRRGLPWGPVARRPPSFPEAEEAPTTDSPARSSASARRRARSVTRDRSEASALCRYVDDDLGARACETAPTRCNDRALDARRYAAVVRHPAAVRTRAPVGR